MPARKVCRPQTCSLPDLTLPYTLASIYGLLLGYASRIERIASLGRLSDEIAQSLYCTTIRLYSGNRLPKCQAGKVDLPQKRPMLF